MQICLRITGTQLGMAVGTLFLVDTYEYAKRNILYWNKTKSRTTNFTIPFEYVRMYINKCCVEMDA